MDKHAAEKIAQEYYSLGVQLAMDKLAPGHIKTANPVNRGKALKKLLGMTANTGIGIGAGLTGAGLGAIGADRALYELWREGLVPLKETPLLATILAGGVGAATALKQAPKFRIH